MFCRFDIILIIIGEVILLHFSLFQITIWGDYGRVEGTKVFMGVAQLLLDNLDMSHIVIGWYKLFGTSSLVSVPPGGGKEAKQAVLGNPQDPQFLEDTGSTLAPTPAPDEGQQPPQTVVN